ncbi:hypothetical protein FRUB_08271 [Fimbriiglobus ruber]|uniref:Uncharacterized protein n=1 Tax=Fimbriiglobus ruber TaxID=1908690 RepID=A0A225DAY9_9BACT|nr:hypothetical protein FRUB_08271 [Fimbriiglobus ruber]
MIGEVNRWLVVGPTCFEELLIKLKIPRPEDSIPDRIFPKVDRAAT